MVMYRVQGSKIPGDPEAHTCCSLPPFNCNVQNNKMKMKTNVNIHRIEQDCTNVDDNQLEDPLP